MTDYEEIANLVAKEEKLYRETMVETGSSLRVESEHLVMDGQRFLLGTGGLDRFCQAVGAPTGYLRQLEPDFRATVLQHHIERGDLMEGRRISIISREGEFLAVGNADLVRLDGSDVLQAVRQGISAPLAGHRLEWHDGSFQLDLISDQKHHDVSPGDALQAGIRVTHWLDGSHATVIEAFVLRLVCTNGLTRRQCLGRGTARTRRLPAERTNARQKQMARVQQLAGTVWESLDEQLQSIGDSREEHVEVEPMLQSWLRRARLGEGLMPRLRDAWREEGGQETVYGVMNALTRVATHDIELSWRQRRALSGLAGVLAFRRHHVCPRCFTVLGAGGVGKEL